jgi:hypothetical protein
MGSCRSTTGVLLSLKNENHTPNSVELPVMREGKIVTQSEDSFGPKLRTEDTEFLPVSGFGRASPGAPDYTD